ncbi:hypothetical protein GCM10011529_29910 [Polymorphobacter glacialis]|uniref:Uncharacterized protein n=1 Tax=Sandarakinorhabdus glacialis TaxID=1614636 RepID=A0A917A0Q9_9SPHN|nr:hypothetical protein [Polymorphobacter glacialis]GGE21314.1 hypothetical protein GCM10011529_29910 [Polymorphobacter glacialis]
MPTMKVDRARLSGDNAPITETGTDFALTGKLKSVGHDAASIGGTTNGSWGGARNRSDRESDCLTLRQAQNIIAACCHAVRLGMPLNRHLTVHLEKSGVARRDGAKAVGALMTLHRQLLASRCLPFACVWVREDDDGDGSKGAHAYILMHVPPDAAPVVTRWQRRWLCRVTGLPYRRGALHTSRIGGKVRAATTSPSIYYPNLEAVVTYLLKGVGGETASALGLSRYNQGGNVIGKRCGWSENIGEAARARVRQPATI